MKMHYLKMLLLNLLINTLVLPHYENYLNNHYNVCFIQKNTKRATIKSRLLAQTKNHNPHYHNDPELKEIIDKMNEEAIKKYQQTHDPYEQLKEVVEKNGKKHVGGHAAEPMSTIEKDLLETYEEMFGDESYMLKSGMHPNDDDISDKSSTCECTDTNTKLGSTKGRDKYLKHLKHRCIGGICSCSVGSAFLAMLGLAFAKKAAEALFVRSLEVCLTHMTIFNMFNPATLNLALKAGGTTCGSAFYDVVMPATSAAMGSFQPYGIAALVLILIVVALIILYIWLYRRRKNFMET
ncbi:stevor [Plasmodium falciparum RAJ116]|uniref:Stevor n=1 Tax=Plasmodium falciparum RAJ116 TaxID=580058 RepID=A0A0L0CSH4_PLAFA|nr:stevor [Plasmodium falciparum RAJ116]